MTKAEYINLLKCSISEGFTGSDRIKLIGMLRGNDVINTNRNRVKNLNGILDCVGLDTISILDSALENKDITLKITEDYEYIKSYKYSAIFKYSGLEQENIDTLIAQDQVIRYNDNSYLSDIFDFVGTVISYPTIKEIGGKKCLKFSLMRTSNRASEEEVKIKYTILVVFYEEHNILEIRLDNLADKFKTDNLFYSTQIRAGIAWLNRYLRITVNDINCRTIIDRITERNTDEVKVYAQYMYLSTQAKATLKVADDGKYVLPILGDLKNLIEQNKEEFEKIECSTVYNLLKDFIREIESTCDLPRIILTWLNQGKDFIVEFIHDYQGNSFSLLQHYGRSQDMEGMEYVTNYVIANRDMD